ncbi:Protein borderless [Eumeta japonica]|uniref:Protein borderless n=1 Tax=Eumeta variegata TaxID=151549 RepID=A0A4C1VUC5_EUMVA|nr:Protein borderless [Eumeta japonica]
MGATNDDAALEVDDTHAGLYSCTPYNSLGSEGPSPAVRVQVLRPPRISPVPRPLYLARLGQPLTMVCGADDNNTPPAIAWTRKDGLPLPEDRYSLDGGNLTFNSVTEEDRGVYVCTAHNDAASTTAMAELMIENVPPRAPYNLTAVASTDSIHVKWVPGYLGQNVEYTIWYRPRAQSEWHTMKILSLGVTEGTLLRLKPGEEYEVRVLAQDHIGDGLFSKPIFVRTTEVETQGSELPIYAAADEDDTDELPTDVTARAIAEGVLVTWNAGAEDRRCNVRCLIPSIRYPILYQVADNALVTPLELKVSTVGSVHLLSHAFPLVCHSNMLLKNVKTRQGLGLVSFSILVLAFHISFILGSDSNPLSVPMFVSALNSDIRTTIVTDVEEGEQYVFVVWCGDGPADASASVSLQDISTRWDSTLQALGRLLEQRVAVQACLPRITCKAELTTEEWIMMEKVVNILRYFEEATKSINKSTATLSDAIPLINSLRKLLENMRGSSPREEENISQKISGKKKRLVELIININEDLYSENASDMVAPTPSTSSEMTASGGLWSVCENIIRESEDDPLSTLSSNNSLKEEVEKYLRSPNIPRDAYPLLFWHNDVPAYSRLRTVAAAAGGAALLLAILAALIYFSRDRICALKDGLTDSKCRR